MFEKTGQSRFYGAGCGKYHKKRRRKIKRISRTSYRFRKCSKKAKRDQYLMMKNTLIYREISRIIKTALKEDIGTGDITTKAIVSPKKMGQAQAIAKDDFVLAGINIFKKVFLLVDERIKFKIFITEGNTAKKGEIIAQVTGALASILQAERVALNIVQRMCGIATQTRRYVEAVNGTKTKILDTRKTIPGLRVLDKMAVKIGGGFNHRLGLYDGVLIKDNHIAAAGSIKSAVAAQKKKMTKT